MGPSSVLASSTCVLDCVFLLRHQWGASLTPLSEQEAVGLQWLEVLMTASLVPWETEPLFLAGKLEEAKEEMVLKDCLLAKLWA